MLIDGYGADATDARTQGATPPDTAPPAGAAPPDARAQAWNQAVREAQTDPSRDRHDDAGLTGLGGAAGRDQYVGAQIGQAERAAQSQPATAYDGPLFRAVATPNAGTYSNHGFSSPGRYNAPGQSTLYTSPSLGDVQAEAGNYTGLDGKSVVRSQFQGSLLDLRNLPRVQPGALSEGFGNGGAHRPALTRLTGEDPYTLPRALGDVARTRGLSGVMAPANGTHTNIALFPDDPNGAATGAPGRLQSGLAALDATAYAGGNAGPPTRFNALPANVPDTTPNRLSPAAIDRATGQPQGVKPYADAVTADADLHGRASGARYGAAGAAGVSLIEGAASGHIDGRQVAGNTILGAASGKAESMLSQTAERFIKPPVTPPNVAGGAAAGAEENAARLALRPASLAAGAGAAGAVGAVVGGGLTAWNDADAVRNHTMTAGQATADVAVQAGVGLGAGAAGAAAGAAVGSVVPVAGTAVGAVVGFGVGMGASWLAQHSGAVGAAENAAGKFLTDHFEQPLQSAWNGVASGVDATKSAASAGEHAVEHLASKAGDLASDAWHAVF